MPDDRTERAEMEKAWLAGYGDPREALPLSECEGDPGTDKWVEGWQAKARVLEGQHRLVWVGVGNDDEGAYGIARCACGHEVRAETALVAEEHFPEHLAGQQEQLREALREMESIGARILTRLKVGKPVEYGEISELNDYVAHARAALAASEGGGDA